MKPVIDIMASGRYTPKEAAKALGVTTSCLRRWHLAGRLPKFRRQRGGWPYYRGADLIRMWEGKY